MAEIKTQLFDNAEELGAVMGPELGAGIDAVVLFCLGLKPSSFVPFARAVSSDTSVLLADCYGIVGFSAEAGRNLELMEAGRGREYGGVGGDGGQGVVAVAFSKGVVASTETLPTQGVAAHLVVAGHGSNVNSFLRSKATATYYGGIAKATFQYDRAKEAFKEVPYFFVSTLSAPTRAVGMTSFTSDVSGSVQELLDKAPAQAAVEAVALFPCFMRGKNEYGINNVESDAVSEMLSNVRIFGMFCHGELGPGRCMGFDASQTPQQSCRQHSMTTIVAVHASTG